MNIGDEKYSLSPFFKVILAGVDLKERSKKETRNKDADLLEANHSRYYIDK